MGLDKTAYEAFISAFKNCCCGMNIMTPDLISLDWVVPDRFVAEISTGRGIYEETIYGVTVVEVKDGRSYKRHDLSKCFHTMKDVSDHLLMIKTL
jgi:hypothetical protein